MSWGLSPPSLCLAGCEARNSTYLRCSWGWEQSLQLQKILSRLGTCDCVGLPFSSIEIFEILENFPPSPASHFLCVFSYLPCSSTRAAGSCLVSFSFLCPFSFSLQVIAMGDQTLKNHSKIEGVEKWQRPGPPRLLSCRLASPGSLGVSWGWG